MALVMQALGLAADEEAAYEALLAAPSQPSPPADPEVLDRLVSVRLATRTAGDPPRYVAVPPATALPALADARERELAEARAKAAELTARFQQAARRRDTSLVEVVTGPENIQQAVREALVGPERGCRRQLSLFETGPYGPDGPTVSAPEAQALAAGVRVRAIYDQQTVSSSPHTVDMLITSISLGENARVGPVPFLMLVSDRPLAILPWAPGVRGKAALFVTDRTLCAALQALFERYWERAIPLAQLDPATADEFVHTNRQLLFLLASGSTDAQIARELDCGERTVRRRLDAMRERLGAHSRFQLGYQAVMQGWLADDVAWAGA